MYAAWDRTTPGTRSVRYWVDAPRGAPIRVDEATFNTILDRASDMGLSIQKSRREFGRSGLKTQVQIRGVPVRPNPAE